ncbi:MAG: aminoglycoside phosphotransferase family protein [Parvibaculaceae bacterium]
MVSALIARLAGDDRIEGIAALLARNGITDLVSAELLAGGKNNKVIRLVPAAGPMRVLKVFFRSGSDTRDRLAHEYSFASFAWKQGLRALPEPIDAEPEHQCALFEFVAGGKPPFPPTHGMMSEALAFIEGLNRDRSGRDAAALRPGSEACFSLAGHIELVDGRLARLRAADLDDDARRWIEAELVALWTEVKGKVLAEARAEGVDPGEALAGSERIISPSDFGFHNAIAREGSGAMCFHDFEYAGWDDPAKLFGDMFGQIEYPLPASYLSEVAASFLSLSARPRDLARRLRWLLPVYGVKWCCIALNPLLAAEAARRQFAGHATGQAELGRERARRQLARAACYHQLKEQLADG